MKKSNALNLKNQIKLKRNIHCRGLFLTTHQVVLGSVLIAINIPTIYGFSK